MSVTELPRKTTLAALRRRLAREIALHREREAAEAEQDTTVRGGTVAGFLIVLAVCIVAFVAVLS